MGRIITVFTSRQNKKADSLVGVSGVGRIIQIGGALWAMIVVISRKALINRLFLQVLVNGSIKPAAAIRRCAVHH
jgi:hypothetical protein